MTNVLDFDADIPHSSVDDDPEPSRLVCEVCGEPLTYGGRGRKPRFCDKHKPGRSTTGTTGTRKRTPSLEVLREELTSTFAGIGTAVYMANKFDGTVILSRSEATANSLIHLAEKDAKIRKALMAAMSASSYLQLAMVFGTVAIPIMWNHGLIYGVPDESGKMRPDPARAETMFMMAGIATPKDASAAGGNE